METVERLLFRFADENTFNRFNSTEITSLINEIGRNLQKLDSSTRYELLNSLYYNTKSNGYSSLLHLCFSRMINDISLKYTLWRAIYIFCELGLNPINVNYLPPNQIMLRHSIKESLNLLREIQQQNEMKEMQTRIRKLKSQESIKSIHSMHSVHSRSMHSITNSVHSTPSSVEFNVGDINDMFGDTDNINYIQNKQTVQNRISNTKKQRISPFHSKLKLQPRSWTDLQLNMIDDNDIVTKKNIIEILKYCNKYKCNNYCSPAIFTVYINLCSSSFVCNSNSSLTILGNAFISLKQFSPQILRFALCKLSNSKLLSFVDNISYYDHNKMNKYEINMKESLNILKHNINIQYKQLKHKRFNDLPLCYLYLIKSFYNRFKYDSYQRFKKKIYNKMNINLKENILNIIQLFTFDEGMTCFNMDTIGINTENKWLCIWFDSLNNTNIYSKKWMDWICRNILKKLSNVQKEYLSAYLSVRGHSLIKNCTNYQLKYCMLYILQKKLKKNNFNTNDIKSYISPKWFLNNTIFTDVKLVQKLLIYCLNNKNYKDLCVYSLWKLLTNASFYIENAFFDEIIHIIIKFSNNNKYFVNGCCQSIVDSIFSIRSHLLKNNIYSQKNITLFLLNLANKTSNGQLFVDINKGLLQCITSPGNAILLKILTNNIELLDFKVCRERGIIDTINGKIQYIQNQSVRNIYYQWYEYNTKLLQLTQSKSNSTSHSNCSSKSISIQSSLSSNLSSTHSTRSLNVEHDEQCVIM